MLKWMWPTRVFAVCAFTCIYTMMKYVLNEIWMNLDEIGANERALHRYIKLPFVKFLFLAHITAILMMVLLEYTRQLTHSHRIKKTHIRMHCKNMGETNHIKVLYKHFIEHESIHPLYLSITTYTTIHKTPLERYKSV